MGNPITVILPVYNTGSLLSRCLDSLLGQTFRDFDVFCVDDGSTDDSGKILDEYSGKDSRISVVHLLENHGVPYARNLALDTISSSEYVYFMDSDDWIDSDYLEAMYAAAIRTGQDVVINCNWYREFESGATRKHSGDFGFIKDVAGYYSPVLVQSRFFPVVWARLYRLKYLKDNKIRSPLLKGGVEDNFFTGLAEILQKKSYIFHGPFYHYWQRQGSLVSQPDSGFHLFENYMAFHDELKRRGLPWGSARLFYITNKLLFDNDSKYDFIRSFFLDIEEEVRSCHTLYSSLDVFTLLEVIKCPDRATWLSKYNPLVWMAFIRESKNSSGFPTVEELLEGKWVL